MRKISELLLLGFCLAALLPGQGLTSVAGTTKDPTGAVIPGAAVVLTNVDTAAERNEISDSQGRYTFSQVQPGSYKLTAKAQGFNDVTVDVRLQINTPATIDLNFEKVGTVSSSVSVSSEAVLVNTTDASIGNAIGTQAITQLPFEARNVVGLLALQPGVAYLGAQDQPVLSTSGNGHVTLNDPRSGAVDGGKSDQGNVTLDGVDVNDQQNRASFTSVLRVTLDSVQEFRTITTNAGAEYGHSSGAQATLVTKSGTNLFHGALYEYLRNTDTSANTFFNNSAGVPRQKLNRNVYGVAIGGPIKKDKLFFFLNYEGRKDASDQALLRVVPTDTLRNGIVQYVRNDGSVGSLNPAQIKQLDLGGIGVDPASLALFQLYPHSNDTTVGDGLNTAGFRFNAPAPLRYNTYIAKLDYQITSKNSFFFRGNLQNDNYAIQGPQFPGQPPNSVYLNNSKGFATGLTTVLSPALVNTLRYGYTREGVQTTGVTESPYVILNSIDNPFGTTTGTSQIIPTHDIHDDIVWNKGAHTFSFGTEFLITHNNYTSNSNSFSTAIEDGLYLQGDGGPLLPADAQRSLTTIDVLDTLLGLQTKLQTRANYDLQGTTLSQGAPVVRIFKEQHYDMYAQDSWKVTRGLNISMGLRLGLNPAIFETQGYNVDSSQPLAQFYANRIYYNSIGESQANAGNVVYNLSKSTGRGLYPFQTNWAPRFGIAYSPQGNSGLSKFLFGGPDRSSIRFGFGIFYDAFGQGLERDFSNSVGFANLIQSQPGQLIAGVPRFTGINSPPLSAFPVAPAGGFPQTAPPVDLQSQTIDDQLKAPYTMNWNLSFGRQFNGGFFLQVSGVHREAVRSLIGEDFAQMTNLKDPTSGETYYQAVAQMAPYVFAGVAPNKVPNIPFWQNMWPGAAGNGLTATQGVYTQFLASGGDWTTALLNVDVNCTPSCSKLGPNSMWNAQYAALYAFRSIGRGNYNGLHVTLRKAFSHGVQFDFNYTWSKCEDLGSSPESIGAVDPQGSIYNGFSQSLNKSVCDYDITHIFSTLGVFELPFGKGRAFMGNANKFVDGLLGGWQVSTVLTVDSGLPVSVQNGIGYPTVWDFTGFATQTGALPAQTTNKNAPSAIPGTSGGPNIFSDPAAALAAFSPTLAGQIGSRNVIRGQGPFSLDMGLSKRFYLFAYKDQPHTLQFRAEAFNITNTVRFDPNSQADVNSNSGGIMSLANPNKFGQYSSTFGTPRVFQFSARYEF
jgi:Carboxypeptidase regulatory-like domain